MFVPFPTPTQYLVHLVLYTNNWEYVNIDPPPHPLPRPRDPSTTTLQHTRTPLPLTNETLSIGLRPGAVRVGFHSVGVFPEVLAAGDGGDEGGVVG